MGILIAILSFLGWTFYLSNIIKRSLDVTLIFGCCTLIILLYVSGLLGILFLTSKIILVIGCLMFLFVILDKRAYLDKIKNCYGFLFFSIATIIFALAASTKYYSNFIFVDDFSHWARVTKLIIENNRLLDTSDPVWFQDYPPGTALFNYYFLQLTSFSAGGAMFSQGLLLLAAFARIFSVIRRQITTKEFLLISIFILLIIHFFGAGLHTLSVDLLLGLLFGVALLGYIVDRQSLTVQVSFLSVLPIVICLPLIKLTGILFSFVIIGYALIEPVFSSLDFRSKFKYFLYFLLISALSFSTYSSWRQYGESMGIQKTFSTDFSAGRIISAFDKEKSSEREEETISAFKRTVLTPYKVNIFTPYYWIAVSTLFVLFLIYLDSSRNTLLKLTPPLLVLLLGFIGYLFVLLILYMYSFSSYEGPRLASIERYSATYLYGILILLFGLALNGFMNKDRGKKVTLIFVALCCLLALPEAGKTLKGIYRLALPKKGTDIEYIASYANFVNTYSPKQAKIYFLMQGSNGTENTIFNYSVLPRKTNRGCWSVGDMYFEGDVWTCVLGPANFLDELSGYDYLFVGYVDEKFNAKYSSALHRKFNNGDFYKIIKREGKLDFSFISQYKNEILVPEIFIKEIGQ